MSIYYCSKCNNQCDNDDTPLVTCSCCCKDVCLDCISEEDDDLCKDCANRPGLS